MNGLLGASTSSHLCLARACGPRTRRGPTGSQCRLTLRTRAQAEPKVDSEGSGSGGTEEIQSKPTKDSISKTGESVLKLHLVPPHCLDICKTSSFICAGRIGPRLPSRAAADSGRIFSV